MVELRRARKNLFVSALCITVARRERSTKQEICALGAASPWTGRGVIVEDWIDPVNDQRNTKLYESYKALADRDRKVIFGGRLGEYRYYDMDKVIESALKLTL